MPAKLANPTKGLIIWPSYEAARDAVTASHSAGGWPIDLAGIRKLLYALRALKVVDWETEGGSPVKRPEPVKA
jgi:hypothetical protein